MAERKFVESVPFSVDSRVAIQLGRESISSSFTAITELVKNAYDADAEDAVITFINLSEPSAALIIEDSGNGMSSTVLKDNWLRIGSDMKIRTNRSPLKHRILTGSKGLGRLGIDRLCNKLILQSRALNSETAIELEINWDKYENSSGTNLTDIKHDVFDIPGKITDEYGQFPLENHKTGTRLILTGLKDNWTEDFLKDLKSELSRLVSPFHSIEDFTIKLLTGYPDVDGKLESRQYLEAAEWKLHAEIGRDNIVSIEVSSSRFEESFQEEPAVWKDWINNRGDVPSCGPLTLEMYYMPDRPDSLLKSVEFDRATIHDFVRNNQGIRIYRDNFRVKPYGEPSGEGDWLTLQHRRAMQPQSVTQRGWRVALHQVVGAVFITREANPGLVDQTNREGIVQEQAFFDLRAFAEKAFAYFEAQVHLWAVRQKEKDEVEKAKNLAEESTSASLSAVDDLKIKVTEMDGAVNAHSPEVSKVLMTEVLKQINEIGTTLNESAKHSKSYEDLLEKKAQDLQSEKNTLSNLASLGILMVSFGHETKGASSVASINAQNLKDGFNEGKFMLLNGVDKKFNDYLDIIQRNTAYVNAFASFALDNIKWDKRKRRVIYLNKIWKYVAVTFSLALDEKNIHLDDKGVLPVLPAVRGFVIDWESIFVNLISNSVWAMEKTTAAERQISVKIYLEKDVLRINFADAGCGLEKGTEDMIFMPTFSTRRNRKGVQTGTGMGLSIVKTFVEEHADGSISVVSPGRLGGAEFDISVPGVIKEGEK